MSRRRTLACSRGCSSRLWSCTASWSSYPSTDGSLSIRRFFTNRHPVKEGSFNTVGVTVVRASGRLYFSSPLGAYSSYIPTLRYLRYLRYQGRVRIPVGHKRFPPTAAAAASQRRARHCLNKRPFHGRFLSPISIYHVDRIVDRHHWVINLTLQQRSIALRQLAVRPCS